jgi:phage regulator Rha-like protein
MRIFKRLADSTCATKVRQLHAMESRLAKLTGWQRESLLHEIENMEADLFQKYGYRGESYYAANYDERI